MMRFDLTDTPAPDPDRVRLEEGAFAEAEGLGAPPEVLEDLARLAVMMRLAPVDVAGDDDGLRPFCFTPRLGGFRPNDREATVRRVARVWPDLAPWQVEEVVKKHPPRRPPGPAA